MRFIGMKSEILKLRFVCTQFNVAFTSWSSPMFKALTMKFTASPSTTHAQLTRRALNEVCPFTPTGHLHMARLNHVQCRALYRWASDLETVLVSLVLTQAFKDYGLQDDDDISRTHFYPIPTALLGDIPSKGFTYLTSLSFADTHCDDQDVFALCEASSGGRLPALRDFQISDCDVSDDAFWFIFSTTTLSSKLASMKLNPMLRVKTCEDDHRTMDAFSQLLAETPDALAKLSHLQVESSEGGFVACAALGALLKQRAVKSLDLLISDINPFEELEYWQEISRCANFSNLSDLQIAGLDGGVVPPLQDGLQPAYKYSSVRNLALDVFEYTLKQIINDNTLLRMLRAMPNLGKIETPSVPEDADLRILLNLLRNCAKADRYLRVRLMFCTTHTMRQVEGIIRLDSLCNMGIEFLTSDDVVIGVIEC